jgi:hypothetical protein
MPGTRPFGVLAAAGFAWVLGTAAPATAAEPAPRATPSVPATSAAAPSDDVLTPEASDARPEGGIPPGSIAWHPWSLFDPYLSPRSLLFSGGPAWERFIGQGYEHGGFEVTVARSIESPPRPRPFLVRLELEFGARVSDPSHWVLSLARYSYAGAIMVGRVELSGRAGTTVAEVHLGSGGFGLGFLAPRVSAAATLDVGAIRIGAIAFSEYSWRWIGGSSAFVQGVLLELSLGRSPDGLPAYYRIKN